MAEENFDLDRVKKRMLRKYPYFGATISSVKYEIVGEKHPVDTAATDGKTIFANAKFMASLSEDEQIFTMAHEVCHIALRHIERSKGKDKRLWNIATDAVINQHLKKDGLPLINGAVNIAEAIHYDAEELYNKLLEEKQKEQQNKQSQTNSSSGQNSQNGNSNQGQQTGENGINNHSMWEEGLKQEGQKKQKGKGNSSNQEEQNKQEQEAQHEGQRQGHDKQEEQEGQGQEEQKQEEQAVSEKEAFKKNDNEKIKRAEEVMRKIGEARRGFDGQTQEVCFDDIGTAGKAVVNWKKMLKRTLEIEDEAWGHKFSDKASGYAARIEDVEYDEKAETEIILDTSGSVSVSLLKNFLRQVKTVLKNSTIRVGTFSNDFYGFVEIKKEKDIDNLKIRVGGGTNFDAASRAFTKRKDVNKICFTDGVDCGDAEIENKRSDIVWISFENPNFKPDNGKVIYVPASQINLERKGKNSEINL